MTTQDFNEVILQYFDIIPVNKLNKKHTQKYLLTHLNADERILKLKAYPVVCEYCGGTHMSDVVINWKRDVGRKKWWGKCGCGNKVSKTKKKTKVYINTELEVISL